MTSAQIEKQIQGMPPLKLGYLAGLLSRNLGMSGTARAVEELGSMYDLGPEQVDSFRRFVCILGTAVTDDEWSASLQTMQHVLRRIA